MISIISQRLSEPIDSAIHVDEDVALAFKSQESTNTAYDEIDGLSSFSNVSRKMASSLINVSNCPAESTSLINGEVSSYIEINGQLLDLKTYFFEVEKWTLRGEISEDRQLAAHRIKQWIYSQELEAPLVLNNLGLTSLPPLPAVIKILDVSNNKLKNAALSLPELKSLNIAYNFFDKLPSLSSCLEYLDARNNQLTTLPVFPARTKKIFVGDNSLSDFPQSLSNTVEVLSAPRNKIKNLSSLSISLTYLDVSGNKMESIAMLPSKLEVAYLNKNHIENLNLSLPKSLRYLGLSENDLKCLPSGMLALSADCRVFLEKNKFSFEQLEELSQQIQMPAYSGPRCYFSMPKRPS